MKEQPALTGTTKKRHVSAKAIAAGDVREVLELTTELLLRGADARALEILSLAVQLHPDDAGMVTRHADALYMSGQIAEAREGYRRACTMDDTEFQAWYGRGCAEFGFEAYADAMVCFRRALALDSEDADTHHFAGRCLFYLGEIERSIEELQIVAKSRNAETRNQALQLIAVIVPGSPRHGNPEIGKARRKWSAHEEKTESIQKHPAPAQRSNTRKLRIGYVSSFFNSQNWMKPVWGMMNEHDRSAFEIHLFLEGSPPDSGNGYMRHADDSIHMIGELTNASAAKEIDEAEIDVLVDLNGYSAAKRLGIFMRKPAPIIASWFNMYATTGIRAFDYIIGDASVVPKSEEKYYGERVLRVSGTYLAFSVLYPVPAVEPPPSLRTGQITFGCLAPNYKLTDGVISTWAEILRAAPNARLLLKNSCMDHASNQALLHERFARYGVGRERMEVEGAAEHYQFLETYKRVDIALDTFPYNGGTTTTEAVWQGVPVLTFTGDRWVSRTSMSILLAGGMGDWVMESREAYIERAIALAIAPGTPEMLAPFRAQMRESLLASSACDVTGLCREMENRYLEMKKLGGTKGRMQRK